jgi:hypothetical protein
LASNVSTLLYSSTQNATRDATGFPVKFTVPTVVNGKVYIGVQHAFTVYGLLNGQPQAATPVLTPSSETFTGSVSVSISDSTPGATLYYTTNGATPTTASTPYTGAITVTSTETIKVIASASGYITSPVASATYTLPTQAATPMLTPAPGVYSFAQSVTITSASSGVTIYYTTDGSTPTTASTKYTTPMTINATTTLQAIAAGNGFTASAVAGGLYTIQISSTTANFSAGFAGSSAAITFNGATQLDDTRLQLTDGGANEASSAFLNTPLNIQAFTTTFAFQLSNPAGEGITFTIQGNSPTALGQTGGGLGYGASTTGGTGGIPNSIAVKLDYVSNQGEGTDSTGLYQNGAAPTIPALDMTASGINLMSDDTMSMQLTYDGTTLFMNLTDNVANKSYAASWPLNLPAIVGGSTAYVGFTGATSTLTSSQKIETWTFTSNAPPPKFSLTPGTYLGTQTVTLSDAVSGVTPTIYYTTNGSTPSTSSTKYTGAITISASETINAIAVATGYGNSAVSTAGYVIESQAPAPTFNPVPGTFVTSVSVTLIDSVSGATIYYTTNGNTPTTTSTQYTAPISIGTTTTIKAIAVVSGYFNSNASSGTYTITAAPLAATPAFSPAGGTYGSAQNVIISDTTTGAAIYYTTNGTMPTTSSSLYSGPVTVSASETLEAIAVAPGYTNSNANSASYVIQTGSQTINFGSGFSSATGLQFNGSAVWSQSSARIRLTDSNAAGYESGNAFYTTPVNIQSFTNSFSFQLTNANADGFTFTIQGDSLTAVGPIGEGLGYGYPGATAFPKSVAVKFDLYDNAGEGSDSTGMYTDGATPTLPAVDMTSSGISLHSGDIMNVLMTYDGTTLSWTVTDAAIGKSFSTSTAVNIPSLVGGSAAYVGFTGGTGGETAIQEILSWVYTPGSTTQSLAATPTISPAAGTYSSAQSVTISDTTPGATIYYTTNGVTPTTSSSAYATPIPVSSSETVEAIAAAVGYANSAITSAAYIINIPQAAAPIISPAAGSYTSAQSVTIGDSTPGATIYYTINGSTPTTSSTKYTNAIPVSASETVEAIAVATGYTNSNVASSSYTIQSGGPTIAFASGFTSATGLTLNGGASVVSDRLRLTDGNTSEARSAFFSTPVNIQSFTNNFSFQLSGAAGDGFTFVIQGDSSPTWVGLSGSGLGYGAAAPGAAIGIPLSIAVKFDIYNNDGEGSNSTGLYINGASPTIPAVDMTSSGVVLASGDILDVAMTYNGSTLAWTITDTISGKSFSTSAPLNLLDVVESPTAYVGFTGSTGGSVATQDIITWSYTGTPIANAKLPIVFQTELLPGTPSGASYGIMDWTGFSDGVGTTLQATAVGNSVTIPINVPASGTYDIRVGSKNTSSRGVMQLSINGANVGAPADEYSLVGYTWNEFDLGIVPLSAGSQPFKFTVSGKDAASSAYQLTFDYITLIPQ